MVDRQAGDYQIERTLIAHGLRPMTRARSWTTNAARCGSAFLRAASSMVSEKSKNHAWASGCSAMSHAGRGCRRRSRRPADARPAATLGARLAAAHRSARPPKGFRPARLPRVLPIPDVAKQELRQSLCGYLMRSAGRLTKGEYSSRTPTVNYRDHAGLHAYPSQAACVGWDQP